MKKNNAHIEKSIEEIRNILSQLYKEEARHHIQIEQVHPYFRKSSANLVHYESLRRQDLSDLQKQLGDLGLNRLAESESHLVASLQSSRDILKALMHDTSKDGAHQRISIKKSRKTLNSITLRLLGYRSKGRRVRIMVTLPSEAADNYKLVASLVAAGMNNARINCAHDNQEVWKKMINNVQKAKKRLRKECKISMDLAGPKIRTGTIEPGPQVRRYKPDKNEFGHILKPVQIVLLSSDQPPRLEGIGVDRTFLATLNLGDVIVLKDARGKRRSLQVTDVSPLKVTTQSFKTCYIEKGTQLKSKKNDKVTSVTYVPWVEQSILLSPGDCLKITMSSTPGSPARYNENGELLEEPSISCTSSEIFQYVRAGEKILFDDGKIIGKIGEVHPDYIRVKIIHTKSVNTALKSDKGINFPDTDHQISGLTQTDLENLPFIVDHADVINFSFVNSEQDVKQLLSELKKVQIPVQIGIILKIETQKAFDNLTSILLEAMKHYPIGVMLARGDLAIETGWENIARIQHEILRVCHAAHVPVVWATQVLETLAKKGIPSRSEITDAATSLNAECVMLNKGPYIIQAVNLLDYILKSLNKYREKNQDFYPAIEKRESISESMAVIE
ncbi:MAG: pyruvate kinase [Bacteroidota bacterium]